MPFRQSGFRRKSSPCNCSHPRESHRAGWDICVLPGCGCAKFRQPFKVQAKRTDCGVHSHDSKFEATVCGEFAFQKTAGLIKDFRVHLKKPLMVNGIKVCDYIVDFEIENNDGTIEYVEAKGLWLGDSKLKSKIFAAAIAGDPNVSYRVIMDQGRGWGRR